MRYLWWSIKDKWSSFKDRCQRFRRGWACTDALVMDWWFLNTVTPMLTYLKEHHTGYPGCMREEEWDAELNRMLELLGEINDARNDDGILSGKCEPEEAKDEFFKLFSKHFYHLWD